MQTTQMTDRKETVTEKVVFQSLALNNTHEHMIALSIWGPYALRRSVNLVFLLFARQNKQASFALTRASVRRFHTSPHAKMMVPEVSVTTQWLVLQKDKDAQRSCAIAVDIAGALSK